MEHEAVLDGLGAVGATTLQHDRTDLEALTTAPTPGGPHRHWSPSAAPASRKAARGDGTPARQPAEAPRHRTTGSPRRPSRSADRSPGRPAVEEVRRSLPAGTRRCRVQAGCRRGPPDRGRWPGRRAAARRALSNSIGAEGRWKVASRRCLLATGHPVTYPSARRHDASTVRPSPGGVSQTESSGPASTRPRVATNEGGELSTGDVDRLLDTASKTPAAGVTTVSIVVDGSDVDGTRTGRPIGHRCG